MIPLYVVVKDKKGHWFRLTDNLGMPFNTMINAGDGIQEPEYGDQLAISQHGTYGGWGILVIIIIFRIKSFIKACRSIGLRTINTAIPLWVHKNKGNWRGYSLLVKEASTGEIRELFDRMTTGKDSIGSTASILLFANTIERPIKAYGFFIWMRETGNVKHFAYGSLKGFDPVRREVLFVYNEPTRTKYILETATGKVRKAAEEEVKSFERRISRLMADGFRPIWIRVRWRSGTRRS